MYKVYHVRLLSKDGLVNNEEINDVNIYDNIENNYQFPNGEEISYLDFLLTMNNAFLNHDNCKEILGSDVKMYFDNYYYDPSLYYKQFSCLGSEVKSAMEEKTGFKIRESMENPIIHSYYTAVPYFYNNNLAYIILLEYTLERSLTNRIPYQISYFCIAGVIVALIFYILSYFHITKGLVSISRKAKNYASQNGTIFTEDFTENHHNDEIGNLSQSLEVLVNKINNKMNILESFSSDVSHELKNPLASLKLSCQFK